MGPTNRVVDAVDRLKGMFLDVPGTQLSLADASKLSGVEKATCQIILEALEDARFLSRRRDGSFVRRTSDSPGF